ncbi:MAG: hypothetical protein NVSMB63_01120 [Sediminibacterium sp.]
MLYLLPTCHSGKQQSGSGKPGADTADFYSLTAFIRNQAAYAKLATHPIYCISSRNGRKDSIVLSKWQFDSLVRLFEERDIAVPALKHLYKETLFQDLSTHSYTLNYSTADPNALVQRTDILLDEATNNVKRIFIRSRITRGDTTITEQYNWKAFKSFQINRFFQTPDGRNVTELNYINWNEEQAN